MQKYILKPILYNILMLFKKNPVIEWLFKPEFRPLYLLFLNCEKVVFNNEFEQLLISQDAVIVDGFPT